MYAVGFERARNSQDTDCVARAPNKIIHAQFHWLAGEQVISFMHSEQQLRTIHISQVNVFPVVYS